MGDSVDAAWNRTATPADAGTGGGGGGGSSAPGQTASGYGYGRGIHHLRDSRLRLLAASPRGLAELGLGHPLAG
ncbi:MAG: hypothetical protein ACR2IK_19495 [Chloroflexota bacterium]